MDLSLKGSQINLVSRQKPKPKYSSQTNLLKATTNRNLRPRSANFIERSTRIRSSTTCCFSRPQSADPKFGRNFHSSCSNYSQDSVDSVLRNRPFSKKKQKKLQSLSSSNLLKLLLDEPIKRSWLCRDSDRDSTTADNQSEISSASRRSSSYLNLSKTLNNERYMSNLRNPIARISSSASSSMLHSVGGANKEEASSLSYPYRLGSAVTQLKLAKPDLPGRVSFSKSQTHVQSDNDSSDYEQSANGYLDSLLAQNKEPDISAPGPVKPTDYQFSKASSETAKLTKEISSLSLKKSVHFGSTQNGEGVLAETFEYPKCPSENCSCSTRSSSSGSLQESLSPKCYCNSPTCKFNAQAGAVTSAPAMENSLTNIETTVKASSKISMDISEPEESQVIRDYKNAVGEQLENSVVKNLLDESKSQKSSASSNNVSSGNLNNFELPSYLSKYSNPLAAKEPLEKPNNLSEKNSSLNQSYKVENPKKDLLKLDNKRDVLAQKSTSETVINNYLKVAASTSSIIKKKETNKDALESKKLNGIESKARPKSSTVAALTQNNIKRAKSIGSLREDSNLHEFNMDKIDSWMSMHEKNDAAAGSTKTLTKHASLEDSFEKFTKETLAAMSALDCDDAAERGEDADEDDKQSQMSHDQSQDDSTYDEIVSVIKEIEEDKKKDSYAERVNSEMHLKLCTTPSVDTPHNPPSMKSDNTKAASNSPDKYHDILSYLDNVEDSCEKTLMETRRSMPDTNRSEVEFVVEPDIAEDVPKLSDLLMLPNHQLARRVVALSLRANELANAVHLSKEHVNKIRAEKQKSVRSEKSNAANRMKEQKKHYEAIVKRHQGFIEQLLKDKGSLCEKVAALTRRLESQNQAWEHKLETEITRVKENTLAGEKIRREKWVRENTKKIKELTVKGLEAEINKMTFNHQKEITELKRQHQQQLLDALEEARLKHEQIETSIRETCAEDRESVISKERNAIRERFEKQLEEERKGFDELKTKLCEDFQAEKERLQQELKTKDVELQAKRCEWQKDKDTELQQVISELQEKMSKQEEKFLNRINTIEKQYQADFELWKKDYESNCKMQHAEKENTIRQHYRAERDKQIDDIVQRMDAEAEKNKEEYENKISRLKAKHEKDLQEFDGVEKSLREKFADTRNKLAESDAQNRNFQAELKQMQIELEHSKKMCSEFLTERDQLRENLRTEIQTEVQALRQERDQEIQKIHKRVQQAIEKKDATIDILQKENGSLRERCLKLEAVIRQQRKDYCVK